MIILGIVKQGRGQNFTGNRAEARGPQLLCKNGQTGLCSLCLLSPVGVNARAILRAAIVALAHALGRIMAFPKDLQQRLISHTRRIKYYANHFVVSGFSAANLFIGRIWRIAGRIAHHGHPNPVDAPKHPLHSPKAAHAKHRLLQPRFWHGLQGTACYKMRCGGGNWGAAPRQGLVPWNHL